MADRFTRFTERAKKVLVLAQQEAQRFNHNYIGTEHLLLGVIAEEQSIGARVLADLGVTMSAGRERLDEIVGRGQKATAGDISLTPRAKRVIDFTTEEARLLGHAYIGTEHLLLGLIRRDHPDAAAVKPIQRADRRATGTLRPVKGESVAIAMLEQLGVDTTVVRQRVLQEVAATAPESPQPRDNVVTCRVDGHTLNVLDALVEGGVHATRSEAAARLIAAGIKSSQPMIEQVFATVTEIRRLREQTQALARQWDAELEASEDEAENEAAEADASEDGRESGDGKAAPT